jgi:hypothetical protein
MPDNGHVLNSGGGVRRQRVSQMNHVPKKGEIKKNNKKLGINMIGK